MQPTSTAFSLSSSVRRQGDRRVAGTGLGLAISRGMIEAMGGTVHAETPPDGRGARIVIRLPMETGTTGGQTP